MANTDTFSRFIFEEHDIRGELVQLHASYLDVTEKKDYPSGVKILLGESIAAATLLSGTLKFEGMLSLQARSTGPISLLMAECTHQRHIRAIAQWQSDQYADCFQTQLSNGQLVITIDPRQGQRYQGIVPMEENSLAQCLEGYFSQSEQLDTRILLFADENYAAGLLLQKLPQAKNDDEDGWNRLSHLAASLHFDELKTLNAEEIIHRLFHEEQVRIYPSEHVSFECSCSRERSAQAIRALGKADTYSLLDRQKAISIDCQFCNKNYNFERKEVDELFSSAKLH
jgi:molecular chaperone Hsp33